MLRIASGTTRKRSRSVARFSRLSVIVLIARHSPAPVASRSAENRGRLFLRLPESDDVALGIAEPGERARLNFHRWHECFSAEGLRLVKTGLQIIDLHIERYVVVRLVTQRSDVAVDRALDSRVDHLGRAGARDVPVEKFRVELFGFRGVPAADFEMDYGVTHCSASCSHCCVRPERNLPP